MSYVFQPNPALNMGQRGNNMGNTKAKKFAKSLIYAGFKGRFNSRQPTYKQPSARWVVSQSDCP